MFIVVGELPFQRIQILHFRVARVVPHLFFFKISRKEQLKKCKYTEKSVSIALNTFVLEVKWLWLK